MKNFIKGGLKRERGGQRRDFDGNQGSRPGMHKTICGDCGKECEVPFRPTGDRPVYCSDCFSKHGPSGLSKSQGRSFQKPGFGDKRMFDAVCGKCGNKCQVPFRPTGDKPVYCSNCFDKGGNLGGKAGGSNAGGKGFDQYKKQLDIINGKLDRILGALMPTISATTKEASIDKAGQIKKKTKAVVKPAAKKAKVKKKK
jgi:CxxC-x17-CxxC domain-containing protein